VGLQVKSSSPGAPVAHPPLKDPTEALNEIALYFNMLGYTEEQWDRKYYSLFMKIFQGIRKVVKETGSLTYQDSASLRSNPKRRPF